MESSDDEEESKPATLPQKGPYPKWVKQLLDGKVPPTITEEPAALRRSRRIEEQKRASAHIVNMALMVAEIMKVKEPANLEEAMADPNWRGAMQSEYDSIIKNHTWDLVDWPTKRKVIGTKWVWKAKYRSNGSLEKYKARLVAKGFAQVEGFDVQETFAPTARLTYSHSNSSCCSWEMGSLADGCKISISEWPPQGGGLCGSAAAGF